MATNPPTSPAQPFLELRLGGLHLIVQRIPTWLVTLVTTASGTGIAWWTSR
ncbi:hypothetical protein AB0B50_01035 [Streptomyces sp. NPDC041068]|uniref:hypothetical protein n=1 Tax=Streptomyces sp. NPDC041068 TaxID=3155130 RepID=UPI0033D4DFDE